MATLDEKKWKQELQSQKFRGVYFLSCEDPLKLEYALNDLKIATGKTKSQDWDIFYGDELDVDRFLESSQTDSLWAQKKYILVRDCQRVTAKKWEQLAPTILEREPTAQIVFCADKFDGRLKFYQSVAKADAAVAMVKFATPDMQEWNQWLKIFLKELEREIAPDAVELLLDWTFGSLHDLKSSLEKAVLLTPGASTITKEQLQASGIKLSPNDIFSFTTALISGDRDGSLRQLALILAQGEEPIALLALLAKQYRWLLQILAHRAEGKNDNQIAAHCRIFPGAAKVLFPASRRLSGKKVMDGLQLLAATDLDLKLSKVPPRMVLTNLVDQLTL